MSKPIVIENDLYKQVKNLSQVMNLSESQLVEIALQNLIDVNKPTQNRQHVVNQGEIYWARVTDIPHPYVVVQDNVFNHSRVDTVIVCALTSNLQRMSQQGNVLLDDGEANLPKQSVVEVAKVSSIKKLQLGEYLGSLSERRIQQIIAGMRFLQTSYFRQ